jgi:hypothetical protein
MVRSDHQFVAAHSKPGSGEGVLAWEREGLAQDAAGSTLEGGMEWERWKTCRKDAAGCTLEACATPLTLVIMRLDDAGAVIYAHVMLD